MAGEGYQDRRGSGGPTAHTGTVDRAELRNWIEDALTRHDRDARERDEIAANVTVDEILDAVWGRLPLEVRRQTSRAQVQASLTMITLRRGIAIAHDQRSDHDQPSEPADHAQPPELPATGA
jgi:hypothetical protein